MAPRYTYEELLAKVETLERTENQCRETIAALRESERRYKELFENANDMIQCVSPDGKILYVNKAWREALGYSDEEIGQLSLMDIVDEKVRPKCQQIFKCFMDGEKLDRNETIFIARDGSRINVEGRCHTQMENGRPVALLSIFRDITERKQAEEALRASEERYRSLFENAHDLIQILRPDGRFLFVNQAWRQVMGYGEEEIPNLTIFDVLSPTCLEGCRGIFQRMMAGDQVRNIETEFITKNGKKVTLEGNARARMKEGRPVSVQCIFRDITERRRMEEELFKSQKLESIGIFAGGIAHDFNNILTAVLGNISLARMLAPRDGKLDRKLLDIERAALRAQALTQQLLTFSKGGQPVKQIIRLADFLPETSRFALRGSNVRCEFGLAPELWPIEGDASQLGQVIQNLVLNADQAMPEGGTITIGAFNLELGAHEVPPLPGGPYVRITVADQGTGIPEKYLSKIFDPYFTTKQKGSGLGLAVAYSVVKNHGGLLTVESRPGEGSVFYIYLPAAAGKTVAASPDQEMIHFGQGRILVMDDEEDVRKVAAELLDFLGYESETAADGAEAVELYRKARERGEPFAAVLMDLTIPGGMGGKEAIQQLRHIDPDVKAIVSSGYATDPIMARFEEYGFRGVTPKPYRAQELSKTLHEVVQEG